MKQRYSTIGGIALIGLLATNLPLIAADTESAGEAGSSWWDSGKKLLENVGTSSTTGSSGSSSSLATDQIYEALKEALKVSTDTVTSQLSTENGFNSDPKIHIELPGYLQTVKPALEATGGSALLEDLELKLNRAAEAATPQAKQIFLDAISNMTLDDARKIYDGADDAATQYFKKNMTPALKEAMQPVVNQSMDEVGLVQSYDNVMSQYSSLPFVPDVKSNLSDYVIEKGLDGMFYYMAEEEAAIRQDPAKQTTEILKKVFGGSSE